jgi:hypothetical protein
VLLARSNDEIDPNDIFSQVMGPERGDRLRMCGGGVSPSDVWGVIPTRTAQHFFTADQRCKMSMLEELVKEQGRQLVEVRVNMAQENLSNRSRNGYLESNQPTTPTNSINSLRVLVPITKGITSLLL